MPPILRIRLDVLCSHFWRRARPPYLRRDTLKPSGEGDGRPGGAGAACRRRGRDGRAAHVASGYDTCETACDAARWKFHEIACAIYREAPPPLTMAGIMIAARCVSALGDIIDDVGREATILGMTAALGGHVAASLLRIEGGAQ